MRLLLLLGTALLASGIAACEGGGDTSSEPRFNASATRVLVLVSGVNSSNPDGRSWLSESNEQFRGWKPLLSRVDLSRYRSALLLSYSPAEGPDGAYEPKDTCHTTNAARNAANLVHESGGLEFDFVAHSLGGAAAITSVAQFMTAADHSRVHAVVTLDSPLDGIDPGFGGVAEQWCVVPGALSGSLHQTLMVGLTSKATSEVDVWSVGNKRDSVVIAASAIPPSGAGNLLVDFGECGRARDVLTGGCPAHSGVLSEADVLDWVELKLSNDGPRYAASRSRPRSAATSGPPTVTVPPVPSTAGSTSIAPTALTSGAPAAAPAQLPRTIGPVASDLPGTPLSIGDSIRSVVDRNTKPRDVYAVTLAAGREVRLSVVDLVGGAFNPMLVNPGAKDLDRSYTTGFDGWMYAGDRKAFTPAVTGTYYLVFRALNSGQAYSFSLTTTGLTSGDGAAATDLPGTPLSLGVSIRSVVDDDTKRRDVYAVNLTAGHEVRLSVVELTGGAFNPMLVNPGAKDLDRSYTTGFDGWMYAGERKAFTPAVTGTYYLVFRALNSGQAYSFSLTPTGFSSGNGGVATDIPGTQLALGETVRSVVDDDTKRRDVYAVTLSAGQEVRLSVVELAGGAFNAMLVNPGTRDLDGSYTTAFDGWMYASDKRTFTPAVTGTYYLVLRSLNSGQAYTLTLAPAP